MSQRFVLRMITGSRYVRDQLVQNGFDENRISIVPPLVRSYHRVKEPSAFPQDIFTPIFSGRLVPAKGLGDLIEAIALLSCPVHLKVLGEGFLLSAMKSRVRSMGLEKKVSFLGFLNPKEHADALCAASCVVVPSRWPEPFGLIGLEAMLARKPVIAYRVGAIPEWLEDQKAGVLVDPGDVHQLADRMNLLAENRDLAERMGDYGQRLAREKYSSQQHCQHLEEIYESALSERREF